MQVMEGLVVSLLGETLVEVHSDLIALLLGIVAKGLDFFSP